MGKWDLLTNITGTDIAYNDLMLLSDQSQTDGTQDRNVTRSALSFAIPKYEVSETSHGFSVGDAVRFDGSNYVEATADTASNAEMIGLVVEVIDTDTFVVQQVGFVTGLSGLTPGSLYYLQDAGGLGATPGTISVPVLQARAATTGWLVPTNAPPNQILVFDVSRDETTDLTVGTGKYVFHMPEAFTLVEVRASVTEEPTGADLQVDINEAGVSVLSSVLTIDASEKTSTTSASPAVISDASIADDAEITIDVDQIGSGQAGKGLKVYLIGRPA